MAEQQKIIIGFHGQTLPVRASRDQIADLIGELGKGASGWYDMQTDDGALFLDLGKIEFVRTDAHEQRVGFGLS
ncbi:hypothetical protein Q5424_04485 [Conexibacter sp. JD483]|uniref:hypothetical protein n=1 Tax=unclassified Conexibacter TaxID=2627773 RepID=UPI002715D0FA|nr:MULTISPECIES: hypothetical protein [unclassified Conexibacter]MDO8184356.1 hypothetical protein [Conexibacter sp. CPCC 205706]MDO8197662.1 hypothetical protein [Conexibacter sp. CPCC 205762]MDR9368325.1 hypothetical protein [Conexibacter sp. JD483]